MTTYRKKLIEVAMPLDAINAASAKEKSIRHGHPSTLHLWWARRPLAAARSVLFGQLVDDPSAWPERFPTEADQDRERQRLFRIIEAMVLWENTTNEVVLDAARKEIAQSFARGRIADGEGTVRDDALLDEDVSMATVRAYLAEVVPPVHDPFAGGGSIPLEAQRLGLRAIATDLNPVAVMINKALIEIPPKFVGRAPVGPEPSGKKPKKALVHGGWTGAKGLAEDVRRYGAWMQNEARKKIGHLYPKVRITAEMAEGRPDLEPYVGQERTVIAWLWARTVESPNPAFRGVNVPLVSNFFLSTKKGKETWVEPVVDGRTYRFEIRTGTPEDAAQIKKGTKTGRGANFRCIVSDSPIEPEHVKSEGRAGRMGERLMAVVLEGNRSRLYLPPSDEMEALARSENPVWEPDQQLPKNPRWFSPPDYGMPSYGDLFTPRQLVALNTFSDLVGIAQKRVREDALAAGWEDDALGLEAGGTGATAYGEAVGVYLALVASKTSVFHNTLSRWRAGASKTAPAFGRQALPMVWDYAEANPFAGAGGDFLGVVDGAQKVVASSPANWSGGTAIQVDACEGQPRDSWRHSLIVNTDPPYYDNIGYADLSDFFYVWLRRLARQTHARLFGTLLVPKATELVATPYRHGGVQGAQDFFQEGMDRAIAKLEVEATTGFPICIYYAFKQTELRDQGVSSTGWETFLQGVIARGLSVVGTWPVRTEGATRLISMGTNALASSVVLVCRRRAAEAPTITRGAFRRLLKRELPAALHMLHKANIAPVDLAQASIGPGMAVFSRNAQVLEADGAPMTVRSALQLIHQVMDELLGEDEGELDLDTRFALTWFESQGFEPGSYGTAETLAKARSVSVSGVQEAGIVHAAGGNVRLLTRSEIPDDWDPTTDKRPTVWEATQHLIKRLDEGGESAAAALLAKLGTTAESARELAYRLYTVCERRNWAEEARAYNGLVIAWPELEKLAGSAVHSGRAAQAALFE